MGNSIYGSLPSTAWKTLRLTALQSALQSAPQTSPQSAPQSALQSAPQSAPQTSQQPEQLVYDLYKTIHQLVKTERIFYDCMKKMVLHQSNRYQIPNDQTFLEQCKRITKKLAELENIVNEKGESGETDYQFPKSLSELKEASRIEADTMRLDIEYGRLQTELAAQLLIESKFTDELLSKKLADKNRHVCLEIKKTWDSWSDERKNARTLQNKTIENVTPDPAALQNWHNWSIM